MCLLVLLNTIHIKSTCRYNSVTVATMLKMRFSLFESNLAVGWPDMYTLFREQHSKFKQNIDYGTKDWSYDAGDISASWVLPVTGLTCTFFSLCPKRLDRSVHKSPQPHAGRIKNILFEKHIKTTYQGFWTRRVYLDYVTCLRCTTLVQNP